MISRIRYLVAFYQGPRFGARDVRPALAFILFNTCHPWRDVRRWLEVRREARRWFRERGL